MQGPIAMRTSSMRVPRAANSRRVAGIISHTTPRQPACTAATTRVATSAIRTGTQSATRMANAWRASPESTASPCTNGGALRIMSGWRSACNTEHPCTCAARTSCLSPIAQARNKRRQFSFTRSHSSGSPGASAIPKFKLSKGAGLTPPMRVLKACANPAACNSGERNHATALSDSTIHCAKWVGAFKESQTQPLLLGFKFRLLALVGGVDGRAILNGLNFKAR